MPEITDKIRASILVVDDDKDIVQTIKGNLELDGYEVLQPADFGDLTGSIKESHPSVVLMDVFLNSADGLELLREIRGDSELAGIPVVMTSGMDVSDQCKDAGASAFVLKPYDPEELASVLREQLQMSGD